MDRIFDKKKMLTTDGITVFIRGEQIELLKSGTIPEWIEFFRGKIASGADEKLASVYERCSRLLLLAVEKESTAELWAAYNVPCITGNEIMCVFKFSCKRVADNFYDEIEILEKEFSV